MKRKSVCIPLFTTKIKIESIHRKREPQNLPVTRQSVPVFNSNMDVLVEQHYVIKFCVHFKKNIMETILFLQEAFRNEVLGVSMIKTCCKIFLNGRESMEFEPQGHQKGMSSVSTNPCYKIENQLKTHSSNSNEWIGNKACSAWVPHFLWMDEIQACFHACTENLAMIINEPEFLTQVITTN